MPDPRLVCFAADAQARGWEVSWAENHDRTELLVIPTLSSLDPELPLDPEHQRMYGLGFGPALGHPHQSPPITFWAWQGWGGNSFICPWAETETDQERLERCPPDHELKLFPVVSSFEEGLALFDQGMARYMACMRRIVLKDLGELDQLHCWADPAPWPAPATPDHT